MKPSRAGIYLQVVYWRGVAVPCIYPTSPIAVRSTYLKSCSHIVPDTLEESYDESRLAGHSLTAVIVQHLIGLAIR